MDNDHRHVALRVRFTADVEADASEVGGGGGGEGGEGGGGGGGGIGFWQDLDLTGKEKVDVI